jgi:hypothetical protein
MRAEGRAKPRGERGTESPCAVGRVLRDGGETDSGIISSMLLRTTRPGPPAPPGRQFKNIFRQIRNIFLERAMAAASSAIDIVRSCFTALDEPVQEYMAGLLSETAVTNVDEVCSAQIECAALYLICMQFDTQHARSDAPTFKRNTVSHTPHTHCRKSVQSCTHTLPPARIHTAPQAFALIGDQLVAYDAAADEAEARAMCERLIALMAASGLCEKRVDEEEERRIAENMKVKCVCALFLRAHGSSF